MQSNGLATIMLLIPVLTVPALAIFGIPQFAPVVASPLDEGQEKSKESRVGNSARQSHDDLFGDVEDLGPEPSAQDNVVSRRRDSIAGSNSRQVAGRRPGKARTGWSDDADDESDWSAKPTRRPSQAFDDLSETGRSSAGKSPKRATIPERVPRDPRRQFDNGKVDSAIRVASAFDEDDRVVSAGFVDEPEPQNSRVSPSRQKDPRNTKRSDSINESLTWKSAVERLNALDIRNFRLEPGHQQGQFIFICSYTPPDNPRVSYRFEAGADEPLKAVEKVLEQIVDWQQSR